jgi:hypothetical protein
MGMGQNLRKGYWDAPYHRTPAGVCQIHPCLTIRILQRSLLEIEKTRHARGAFEELINANYGCVSSG